MSWLSFRLSYFPGKDFLEKKRFEEAEKHLEKALVTFPSHPDAILALAETKWRLGKKEEALKLAGTLLEKDSTFSPAHYLLGTFYMEENEASKAGEAFEKAVACDAKNVEAWYSLGKASVRLHETAKALHAFHQVTRADPFITLSRLQVLQEKRGAARKS